MNGARGPKALLARVHPQHVQAPQPDDIVASEVTPRLEGAASLLSAAQLGRIDADVAELGALGLVDGALHHLLAVR